MYIIHTMITGRPKKLTKLAIKELKQAFYNYIEVTNDCTIVGFCATDETAKKYWLTKDDVYKYEEFSELRKRAIQKQEMYLLSSIDSKNGLNPAIAIFRLKQPQHGYSDKQEQVISGTVTALPADTSVVDDLIRQLKQNTAIEGETVGRKVIKP